MRIQALSFWAKPKVQQMRFSGEIAEFELSFGSDSTDSISQTRDAAKIEEALNGLPAIQGIGKVSVVITEASDTNLIFNIIFMSNSTQLPNVEANVEHESSTLQEFTLNVTEFRVGFHPRFIDYLPIYASSQLLEQSVTKLFITKCSRSRLGTTYFVDTFELESDRLPPAGTRDASVQAFCGRYSTKNPSVIFRAGQSVQEANNNSLQQFTVVENPRRAAYKYVSVLL